MNREGSLGRSHPSPKGESVLRDQAYSLRLSLRGSLLPHTSPGASQPD